MKQEKRKECLRVLDILKQNEELRAFMDYNKDYFNELKKRLDVNFYQSPTHFYRSLTFRFFRPENDVFKTLIISFRCLCDNIVMNNFGNSFVNFVGTNDSDYDIAVRNLHLCYIDLKGRELAYNFRNYINRGVNLVTNDAESKDYLDTNQTDSFFSKISYTGKTVHNEFSKLKDIKSIRQEDNVKKIKKTIRNRYLKEQRQQSLLTHTNIKIDLDIHYPELEEPSSKALPTLW